MDEQENVTTDDLARRTAELDARERAIAARENEAHTAPDDATADREAARATGSPTEPDDILTPEERDVSDREKAARPHVEQAPQTPEEVKALADAFAEYRKEVAALRKELAAHRPRTQQIAATSETPEQRQEAHLALVAEHSHYCPGCGMLGKYAQRCTGHIERPHSPIEMVTTDELGGDPADHTAAPATEELAA